jgi:hypothetical protein
MIPVATHPATVPGTPAIAFTPALTAWLSGWQPENGLSAFSTICPALQLPFDLVLSFVTCAPARVAVALIAAGPAPEEAPRAAEGALSTSRQARVKMAARERLTLELRS